MKRIFTNCGDKSTKFRGRLIATGQAIEVETTACSACQKREINSRDALARWGGNGGPWGWAGFTGRGLAAAIRAAERRCATNCGGRP